jgi:very-short-patch-repair endonuclease
MGKILSGENFKREVRVGRYFLDFGNDVFWGIEIDGRKFHLDIVAEFDRDSYLYERGWRIKHIDAIKVFNEPDVVMRDVLQFFYK